MMAVCLVKSGHKLILFRLENGSPFVHSAIFTGMMGQLRLAAFRAGSHADGFGFFVGPALVPFGLGCFSLRYSHE
jgi:hypothetical protein